MDTTTELNQAEHDQTKVEPKLSLWALWKEDVLCVFERDPAARNWFEVLTLYPGVHAILLHRLSHGLWRRGWFYLARFLAFFSRFISNIDIHPGAQIGRRFFIDHGIGVVVGETAIIGNDVTLYHGVTLGGTSWNKGRRHPHLGDGVLVGAGAKILGPISIGDNVRVGANSVVIKNIPANVSVVGIPGRIVQRSKSASQNDGDTSLFDLNHHLIPDPVGKAMQCMLERIVELEQRAHVKRDDEKSRCPACEALDVCVCKKVESKH